MPDDEDLIEIVQLTDPRQALYELALPTMINTLLTGGSSAMMTKISSYSFD